MQRLFVSPGTKIRIAKQLIARYPSHMTYIEPFAGAAACFWEKTPSPKEALNDYDSDIVRAYEFVKRASTADIRDLADMDWILTEPKFEESKIAIDNELLHTYRFLYRRKGSFGSKEKNIMRAKIGKRLTVTAQQLWDQHNRLRSVQITQGDGLDTMRDNDRPGVFMFVDPPWPEYWDKWEHYTFDEMQKLIDLLGSLEHAKWMWAETPTLFDHFTIPGEWKQETITWNGTSFGGRKTVRSETVFTNY
tara:strand:- start:60 stop:803 length:744 start_codon:yes stop_codon:yes gene_type:complete